MPGADQWQLQPQGASVVPGISVPEARTLSEPSRAVDMVALMKE